MPRWLLLALVAAALLLNVTACVPREQGGPPAPSSSLTKEQAIQVASFAAAFSGGTVSTFSATGSMLPLIDSRTIAVWEPITPATTLYVGDIVAFPRGDLSVAHTVTAVSGQHVRTRGTNADASDDGWQTPNRRLIALFYSAR